jgi:enterobactin synthetase component D
MEKLIPRALSIYHRLAIHDDVESCAVYIQDENVESGDMFEPFWGFPESLEGAVLKRRIQYLAGRWCAREAMRRLGAVPVPIDRDRDGRPIWPAGFTGSITHSDRIAAAAVARSDAIEALGIDCEALLEPDVADEIAASIATPREICRLVTSGLCAAAGISLIFSAKEALYKCLNPIVRRFFDHHAAELTEADPASGHFSIRLCVDLAPRFPAGRVVAGRFGIGDGHIQTAIALPR